MAKKQKTQQNASAFCRGVERVACGPARGVHELRQGVSSLYGARVKMAQLRHRSLLSPRQAGASPKRVPQGSQRQRLGGLTRKALGLLPTLPTPPSFHPSPGAAQPRSRLQARGLPERPLPPFSMPAAALAGGSCCCCSPGAGWSGGGPLPPRAFLLHMFTAL